MIAEQSKYAVQLSRHFLRLDTFIGLWPIADNASRRFKLFNVLLVLITYWLKMFILVPCALHTFLEESNIAIRIKLIGPMSFAVMAVTKYISLTRRTKEIAECFKHVEEDWQNSCGAEKTVMFRHAKIGRSLSIFSAIFMYGGGIFYHGIMPMAAVQTFSANVDHDSENDVYNVTANDLLTQNATTREARLAVIVMRHIRALKFATRVEEYLNGICFIEFIGCTMNICFIGYYCLTEWKRKEPISTTTYFILLTSFTTNIFIFCYIGELLTEQCTRVGSIYHIIDWYNLPGKSASDLFFIIAISRYPTKLTAGKFVDLTLITFSNVMKSAFTYFNLIRTMII